MTVVSMSNQEFLRLQFLLDVEAGRFRIEDAAQLIGLGCPHVFRVLKGHQWPFHAHFLPHYGLLFEFLLSSRI